jgi:ATP adenylyltransferase
VPEHFILATTAFKPQTHLLEPEDLAATYACIDAYHGTGDGDGNGELFAFFNSGVHSGASQPHRHIQLLPVARMRDGIDAAPSHAAAWDVLAKRLPMDPPPRTPFTTFATSITEDMTPHGLHAAYIDLYHRACRAVDGFMHHSAVPADEATSGEARISYNMAMTRHELVVCPRLSEGATIIQAGKAIGKMSLNGTLLAGTVLVKSQTEYDTLKKDQNLLVDVLRQIGVPTGAGRGLAETE